MDVDTLTKNASVSGIHPKQLGLGIKLYIKQMQGTDKGFIYAVSWSINVGFLGGPLFLLGLKKKTYIVIWHRVTTNILT